jgi:hypothetical protein
MSPVLPSSLASQLPQGFGVIARVVDKAIFMTLLFQSAL